MLEHQALKSATTLKPGGGEQAAATKFVSSKYDFVKVRVWLQDPDEAEGTHYYVLSRYHVSRMLTVTQMDVRHAIRLALELKKQLVDRQQLDISQPDMEVHCGCHIATCEQQHLFPLYPHRAFPS